MINQLEWGGVGGSGGICAVTNIKGNDNDNDNENILFDH